MNRRNTLQLLLGQKQTIKKSEAALPPETGLEPFEGNFKKEHAVHLLRRTIYGPTKDQVDYAVEVGLDEIVQELLTDLPDPPTPINYFEPNTNTPIGDTWVNKPADQIFNYRRKSARAWSIGLMNTQGISLREKMTLFWHNHFVTNLLDIEEPRYSYQYLALLRRHVFGNFRQLVKEITIDPAMLFYLNGNANNYQQPNENYARELLELFTIGKGPIVGPGDYTNYTEEDVMTTARVLTGWTDYGWLDIHNPEYGSEFRSLRHDIGDKQLSHRFNNAIIQNNGENEYADLIDVIFQQSAVARFICRKIYRWFVDYVVDDEAEEMMIEAMATLLIANDYEIKPLLEALLKSKHFYDKSRVGAMIKNPMDYVVGLVNQFEVASPVGIFGKYEFWYDLHKVGTLLQMSYLDPPNVAGWKAYYQEPLFYRTWINSVTLPERMNYTKQMLDEGFKIYGDYYKVDVLAFVASLSEPADPNILIEELSFIFFAKPISTAQKEYLKNLLLTGLPDFEWTIEYSDYANDPDNIAMANSIENKLKMLIQTMLNMPEYQLM